MMRNGSLASWGTGCTLGILSICPNKKLVHQVPSINMLMFMPISKYIFHLSHQVGAGVGPPTYER